MYVRHMKPIDLSLIQARRKRLRAEIAEHEAAIEKLRDEDNELTVAERVFARLSGEIIEPDLNATAIEDETDATPAGRSAKPSGIPKMPEMIREALAHAHELGSPGLEPSGIVSFIQGRWWPGIPAISVGPIAWRMWKRGELVKEGNRYALPNHSSKEETGAVAAPVSH